MDKPYQLRCFSHDWMEPFSIDYCETLAQAEERLKEYQARVRIKDWRVYKVELIKSSEE